MANNNSVRPEDILPNGIDSTAINGKIVRKGSVAAFLANIDILENLTASAQQKQEAINTMKELVPALVAIGLHKHATFKNSQAEQILVDTKGFQ
jgi:hypothetical protein